MKGDGRIYRRKYRRPDGELVHVETWTVGLYMPGAGREVSFPTHSAKHADAVALLKKKRAERDGSPGQAMPLRPERVLVSQLLDAWEAKATEKEAKGLRQAKVHANQIRKHFGTWKAIAITPDAGRAYVAMRREPRKATKPGRPDKPGMKNATINRELEILRGAFKLAVKEKRLSFVPDLPQLPENNARQGFFERAEFEEVVKRLEPVFADACELGYAMGWRKGEIVGLRWEYVDAGAREIRIPDSKNGEPRSIPLDEELWAVIERRAAAQVYRRGETSVLSEYVFHIDGAPLGESLFLTRWNAACKAAGLEGKLFHDLRRTAARDMIRAGVPRVIAKTITGHRTDSMFDRYNIVDETDKRNALAARRTYLETQGKKKNVLPFVADSGAVSK